MFVRYILLGVVLGVSGLNSTNAASKADVSHQKPAVLASLKVHAGLHSYIYQILLPDSEVLEFFSVDVSLPIMETRPLLKDEGLPTGYCAVNADRSAYYHLSLVIKTSVSLLSNLVEPINAIMESNASSNQSAYETRLASWLPALKMQNEEISPRISLLAKSVKEFEKHPVSFSVDHLVFLNELNKQLQAQYDFIENTPLDNLSIDQMAVIVESFVNVIRNYKMASEEFYSHAWSNRLRVPVAIVNTLSNKSSHNTFSCEFKGQKQAAWSFDKNNHQKVMTTEIASYGKPVLRGYELIYRNRLTNTLSTHWAFTIGPGLYSPEILWRDAIMNLIKAIHIAYQEGWIKSPVVANQLIAKMNHLISEENALSIAGIQSRIQKLINFVGENSCYNREVCGGNIMTDEVYSLLVPALEHIISTISDAPGLQ